MGYRRITYLLIGVLLAMLFPKNAIATSPTTRNKRPTVNALIRESVDSLCYYSPFRPAHILVGKDSVLRRINNSSGFGIGCDNYFVTGIPLNEKITSNTADAKYQISIQQRITKARLPLNSYLVLRYTQKSFWDIYKFSSPFRDNNYNPSLGTITPVFKDDRMLGFFSLFLEHESNGRDSIWSRSWNFLSASFLYFYNPKVSIQLKMWAPLVDKEGNPDLLDYRGIGFLAINYQNMSQRVKASIVINPGLKLDRWNIMAEICYNPFRTMNQYFYLQFYEGYGEGLLNYKEHTCKLRAGICIKQDFVTFH